MLPGDLNIDPHSGSVLDALLMEIGSAPYIEEAGRNWPPHYYFARARYVAPAEDVARMRRALSGLPRVDESTYDILFNAVSGTWDVVRWVELPEPMGVVPGHGPMTRVVLEPFDVYSIDAGRRTPATLGEVDWAAMRRLCTTMRGGDAITEALHEQNRAVWEAQEAQRQDAEADASEYMRKLLLRINDETGYGDLSPAEMARRTGTSVAEWDDFQPDE